MYKVEGLVERLDIGRVDGPGDDEQFGSKSAMRNWK